MEHLRSALTERRVSSHLFKSIEFSDPTACDFVEDVHEQRPCQSVEIKPKQSSENGVLSSHIGVVQIVENMIKHSFTHSRKELMHLP